jgi:hypothetical protein
MRGKRLEAHKQRLRELATKDRARRCQRCWRALPSIGAVEDWASGRRFCSFDCYEDAKGLPGDPERDFTEAGRAKKLTRIGR